MHPHTSPLPPTSSRTVPPTIGVVIAAYQAADYLGPTLQSLAEQSRGDWHCVVVDDGSTDGTAEIAERAASLDDRVHLLRQANAGVSAARNAGFDALPASVTLVCFLDSDDLLLPEALGTLAAALEARPDASGCSGWAEAIDGDGAEVAPGSHRAQQTARAAYRRGRAVQLDLDDDSTFESLVIRGTIWPPATALMRAPVVRACGGFDPALRFQEDWDLFLRASRRAPIAFVDRQVAWYRRHDGNATKDDADFLQGEALLRRKAWLDPANTRRQRALVLRAHLRSRAWLIKHQLEMLPKAIGQRSAGALLCTCSWLAYGLVELARVRPTPPRPAVLRRLVDLDARYRQGVGLDPSSTAN